MIQEIIDRIAGIEHGFHTVWEEARNRLKIKRPDEILANADTLFEHNIYLARMLAAFLWGYYASGNPHFLKMGSNLKI